MSSYVIVWREHFHDDSDTRSCTGSSDASVTGTRVECESDELADDHGRDLGQRPSEPGLDGLGRFSEPHACRHALRLSLPVWQT